MFWIWRWRNKWRAKCLSWRKWWWQYPATIQRKEKNERTILVSFVKQANVAANPAAPVFIYIPKSRRKDEEPLFYECTNPKSTTKIEHKFNEASWRILKGKGVLPVHRANPSKLTKVSLPGFVASSKDSLQEESELSKMAISGGCYPNAHKLMKRSSYDFSQSTSLGHVIEAKPYGLNSMQRVIQSQGGNVATPKVGLSYVPPQLMRILGRLKYK